jgi:hypothetical protein
MNSSYEVYRNYRQRAAPRDTLIKIETNVFLDNISIHIAFSQKIPVCRNFWKVVSLVLTPVPTAILLLCKTVGVQSNP